MTRQNLIVVGNATSDEIYCTERLPQDDEVSAATSKIACFGGRGVVPALVLAALGTRPSLCTVVGADMQASLEPFLLTHNVATGLVDWDQKGSGITRYVAFACPNEGTTQAIALPAEVDWRPSENQQQGISEASILYFSTNPPRYNYALLDHVAPATQIVVHNLGIRFEQLPQYVPRMLECSTILVGNHLELERLVHFTAAGPRDLFRYKNIEWIIVTSGKAEIVIYHRANQRPIFFQPQIQSLPNIPIGAGDSFAAGIVDGFVRGRDPLESLELACSLGAAATRSPSSFPDLTEVTEMGMR